jgi:uncharacterized membrane protein YjjP (DUF1212 family)
MSKLVKVEELVDVVVDLKLSKESSLERLADIAKQTNPWGTLILLVSYVHVGTGNAALFGGNWRDILVEILLSLVVGGIASAVLELHHVAIILASIKMLVPALTIAVGELCTGISYARIGIVHFVYGLFYLLKQIAGA